MRTNPSLEMRSLEIFLAVCRAGGMGAAGRQLGITQGAVSQQVSRLEALLDVKVIDRESRAFRLLPAGLTLQHHAQRILNELQATEHAMRQFRGFSFPTLSVQVMESLGKTLANNIAETLQGRVERLHVSAATPHLHRDELASGKIDILITSLDFDAEFFDVHHIAVEPLVLIVPKGFVAADELELDQLAVMLPFVQFSDQRPLRLMATRYLAHQLVNPMRSIEVDQATAVIDTVRSGRGWALTSLFSLLDPAFDAKEIDVLALPKPVPTRSINLIARRGMFADLPHIVAENCREHLRQQYKSRLYGTVPEAIL